MVHVLDKYKAIRHDFLTGTERQLLDRKLSLYRELTVLIDKFGKEFAEDLDTFINITKIRENAHIESNKR